MLRLRFRCVVDMVFPRGNGGFELVTFKMLSESPIPSSLLSVDCVILAVVDSVVIDSRLNDLNIVGDVVVADVVVFVVAFVGVGVAVDESM